MKCTAAFHWFGSAGAAGGCCGRGNAFVWLEKVQDIDNCTLTIDYNNPLTLLLLLVSL